MNEFPPPAPSPQPLTRRRRASRFPASVPPVPREQQATWGITLSFLVAGLWSLLFARVVALPGWLAVVLLIVGFVAIFVALIAAGTDLDNWRRARRRH